MRLRLARRDRGAVAIVTAILMLVFLSLTAFAVDVGNWYAVGLQEQRAADAAALAGVVRLPADQLSAKSVAQSFASQNGFTNGVNSVSVVPGVGSQPTRLKVTVSKTVPNVFGALLGRPTTTVTKSAVADYVGPVPLGSPCNAFGNDPDQGANRSTNCDGTGAFWANVGSKKATKASGDAYQDNVCGGADDGCVSGTNLDYDPNGYVYLVTLRQAVTNLKIQAFDPAQVVVGDHCNYAYAKLAEAAALGTNADVSNPAERYAPNDGAWCTGDTQINAPAAAGNGLIKTQFTIHAPGVNAWDPLNWPVLPSCQTTFDPFSGDLSKALDHTQPLGIYKPEVARTFRQWVDLCAVTGVIPKGTYAVQVKTNGLGTDLVGGHNRFGLRAFGSGGGDKDNISISGFNKMAMYGNTPEGISTFYLAKVAPSAAGQSFNVRLFDIGDGATAGSTIRVVPPPDSGLTNFSGCTGSGPLTGTGDLTNCTISVNSTYNGKWESISVPIPLGYTCAEATTTGCWVRLEFYYGASSSPADTTSWTAGIEGDPVRLVE